jgi:hypothetical protein
MVRVAFVILVLGLLLAAPIHASIIFDNLALSRATLTPMALPGFWIAQQFVPVTAATLDTVILRMARNSSAEDAPVVELYSGATQPTVSLGTLTSSGFPISDMGWTNVTFEGTNLPLMAGTAYWIVMKAPTSSYTWRAVNADTCGSCGPAFSAVSFHTDSNGAWWVDSPVHPLTMQVNATDAQVPEPATLWLVAPMGVLMLRRRTA